jgi:hypothetical protein
VGNALKVVKTDPGTLRFDWSAAATTPENFHIHQTNDKTRLADTMAAIGSQPAVPVDSAKTHDMPNPQHTFYEVWPRNSCTNESVIP